MEEQYVPPFIVLSQYPSENLFLQNYDKAILANIKLFETLYVYLLLTPKTVNV